MSKNKGHNEKTTVDLVDNGSLVPQEEGALLAQGRGRGQQAGPGQLCSEQACVTYRTVGLQSQPPGVSLA